jgi:hypothetical protein
MPASWLNSFKQYLDRQARILQRHGYGQSSKVDDYGWCDSSEEIRCYASIHYFFQIGLGKQERRIEEVLNMIHHYQKDNGRGTYTAYFYPFGFMDPDLETRSTKNLYPHTKMTLFSHGICVMSGTTEPEHAPTTQVLRPAEGEDFWAFFCRTRSVSLDINAAQRYAKMKERCAWFFLADAEPQWEPGNRFRPAIEQLPQT